MPGRTYRHHPETAGEEDQPDRLVTIRGWRTGSAGCGGSSTRSTRPGCSAGMPANLPKHVGVMLDGNRRWAKSVGRDTAHGHRAGAANIEPLLGWCDEVGIEVVTLWLLSTDNLNRPPRRADAAAGDHRGRRRRRWPTSAAGGCTRSARSTCCPSSTAEKLKAAEEATRDVDGMLVNIAVGLRRPPRDHRRRPVAAQRAREPRAPRSRSSPRSSTSSTSPSTSTPRASPTPTW